MVFDSDYTVIRVAAIDLYWCQINRPWGLIGQRLPDLVDQIMDVEVLMRAIDGALATGQQHNCHIAIRLNGHTWMGRLAEVAPDAHGSVSCRIYAPTHTERERELRASTCQSRS